MSAATPGPWEAHRIDGTGALSIRQRGDARSRWIAHTINSGHKTPEEANANAKLIAAAPDLADVLEALLPWAEGNHDGSRHCDCDRCEKLDAARAALRAAGRIP